MTGGDNATYAQLNSFTSIAKTRVENSLATLDAAIQPLRDEHQLKLDAYRDWLVQLLDVEFEVHRYEALAAEGQDVAAQLAQWQQTYNDKKNTEGPPLKQAIEDADAAIDAAIKARADANYYIAYMDEELRVLNDYKTAWQTT